MSLLGSLVSSATDIWATNKSNKAAKHAADAANDRNIDFYKKRHQREIADLEASGLNPVMSAGGSPGSVSASAAQVFKADPAGAFSKGASAGQSSASAKSVKSKLGAELALLRDQGANIREDTTLKRAQATAALSSARKIDNEASIAGLAAEGAEAVTEFFGGEGYGAVSAKSIKDRARRVIANKAAMRNVPRPKRKPGSHVNVKGKRRYMPAWMIDSSRKVR
jgi:hypothetical protein